MGFVLTDPVFDFLIVSRKSEKVMVDFHKIYGTGDRLYYDKNVKLWKG